MPRMPKLSRASPVYRGQGAYKRRRAKGKGAYNIDDGPWANRGDIVGRTIGSAFGPTAAQIGGFLGRRLFHYPAKYFGSGAYHRRRVKGKGSYDVENVVAGTLAPEIPRFSKGGDDDSIIVSHREYIGDIFTSSSANTFKVDDFKLNVGDPVTFPWLSTVAQTSFQQYQFQGCIFEFVSTSSDALNSTNTALGAVIACVNYDSNDAAFTSRMQMENTSWANCCKPSQNMSIPVECKPKQSAMNGLLYVSQNGVLPASADPKTYYLGKVSIATTGFQGTSINIGSLYVTYKVKLYKPIMLAPLANANRLEFVRSGAATATPFGSAFVSEPASDCDTFGVTFTTTTMTIPKERLQIGQRFLVIHEINGTGAAYTEQTWTYTPSGAVTALGVFGSTAGNTAISAPNDTVSATHVVKVQLISITNDAADVVLTISGGALPTAATANISIWQVCGTPSTTLGVVTDP